MTTITINWTVLLFILELFVIVGAVYMMTQFSTQQYKNRKARLAWGIILLYAVGNAIDYYEVLFK